MLSCAVVIGTLTITTWQTKTDTSANRVDPDEMTRNKPSYQDLHCLPYCLDFRRKTLFASMDISKFKDGIVHFRNRGVKGLRKVTSLLLKRRMERLGEEIKPL